MKDTDQMIMSAGETIEYARQYMKQQGDLIRLETAERISKTTSALVTAMVIGIIVILIVIMLSLAIVFYLADLWEGAYANAFLAVAGMYMAVGALVFFFKKQLVANPILNLVINAFFDDDEK